MSKQRRQPRMVVAILGLVLAVVGAAPVTAAADDDQLAVFDGHAASHSLFVQGRANAVFALPADFYVGATFAEVNSQPRAQAYGATVGFPLARNATGVGVPAPEYRGQCWANYPGEPREDACGLPVREFPHPAPPEGSPVTGGFSVAHVEAAGDASDPEQTVARGTAAWGLLEIPDVVRIGHNTSESRSFIENGVLHAVTVAHAQEITVGDVLHIGSIEAVAEATHSGDPEGGKGMARTDMQNVSIAGVPVTMGPEGLSIQGQPLGEAPDAVAAPVLAALAGQRMTIEPFQPPRVTRDDASGLVEATTFGVRVVMFSPGGDKLELTFGQASARAAATRTEDDVPLDFVVPAGEPSADAEGQAAAPLSEPAVAPRQHSRVPVRI